jgi:hypothetical protein
MGLGQSAPSCRLEIKSVHSKIDMEIEKLRKSMMEDNDRTMLGKKIDETKAMIAEHINKSVSKYAEVLNGGAKRRSKKSSKKTGKRHSKK